MNNNFEMLPRIVDRLCRDQQRPAELRAALHRELNVAKSSLRYGYDNHLVKKSNSVSHSIARALSLSSSHHAGSSYSTECQGCSLPFQAASSGKQLCVGDPKALEVAEACKKKLLIYMGHQVRVKNQKDQIWEIIQDM